MSEELNNKENMTNQAFSEEIRRKLAEPDSGKPTLEEFKLMVYKDREKRRKKRNTMVACIIAAFLVGFLSFEHLVPEVGADKNPKEEIVTEDGVIIEDGGYGSREEADNVLLINNFNDIEYVKKHYPEVLIPNYIPKGYVFSELKVEGITEKDIICEYTFIDSNKAKFEIEVLIIESGELTTRVYEEYTCIESQLGSVYFQKNENIATMQFDENTIINIWYETSVSEVIKVIEAFKN